MCVCRYGECVCVGRVASICVQTCVFGGGGGGSDTRVLMMKRKLPHKTKCTFQSRDSID